MGSQPLLGLQHDYVRYAQFIGIMAPSKPGVFFTPLPTVMISHTTSG
jgi:hypothetical protein